ncbi:F0F1 ATP synthase subunit delta [Hutsoniella sourekii]|uniref:F0F1 ATP synthase subunit delta n=1 Tax=Hutsoniella sourekii TaxID=87650 RepID=UPI0004B35BD7|nr:F0F1 ATP synthase subunit delta [Hutsoniella sourekii]
MTNLNLTLLEDKMSRRAPKKDTLTITSAQELTDQEKQEIIDIFADKIHRDFKEVIYIVDPDLIAGVHVQSTAYSYEWSAQKLLRDLARSLIKK